MTSEPENPDIAEASPNGSFTAAASGDGTPVRRPRSGPRPWETLFLVIAVALTVVWALGGRGTFWPAWVWLNLAAIAGAIRLVGSPRTPGPPGPSRWRGLVTHALLAGLVSAYMVVTWALAGAPRTFWPIWILLVFGTSLAVHAIVVNHERARSSRREEHLVESVSELRRSRSSAIDAEAVHLRRIERDLHDGAQARLVALTITLGRAEERAAGQPELARMIGEARSEAGAAIRELRDLARGIAPPILADRGIGAAVDSLAGRAPLPVTVEADPEARYPAAVENAAYFVVAEALTNVAKHAGAARAHIGIRHRLRTLVVEVADDGCGGAQAGGGGLAGLRSRVEALDGTLAVAEAPGGGTIVTARIPCAS
jgi:signal transduction histidine kinase